MLLRFTDLPKLHLPFKGAASLKIGKVKTYFGT
jgi:hypothetical protein